MPCNLVCGPMLPLKKLRALNLAKPVQTGGPSHLSAASGLVRKNAYLYVVADDELSLGVFGAADNEPGILVELLPGELPLDAKARKAAKPDFESLTTLPPFPGFQHGALLALGSGSKKKTRQIAVIAGLDQAGTVRGAVASFDLAAFYEPLHREFAGLNIEGALVSGDELRLFQRGNKKDRSNAIIRCQLQPVLNAIGLERAVDPAEIIAVVPVELSEIDGLPLSFTDAALLPDGNMIFSAAAEDTEDAYEDGNCVGSAVGIVGPQGNLIFLEQTDLIVKLEGIAVVPDENGIGVLLVSDADDPDVAASLFSTRIMHR
jgi:hypothetical protein